MSLSFSVFPLTSGFLVLWPSLLLCRLSPVRSFVGPKLGTLFSCWWFSGARWIVLHWLIGWLWRTLHKSPLLFPHPFACYHSWKALQAIPGVENLPWPVLGCLDSLWISVIERHVTKGGMEPAWGAIVTGETNGYWPVARTTSPVWLARATAQTQGQSLAEMASERSPGSPLAPAECEHAAGWCCWLMQLSVLSFD